VVCACTVVETRELGSYRVLTFEAPDIARAAMPGQFVNVAVGDGCGLLRRPFSVYLIDPDAGTVSIVFDAIGEGTRWLATRAPGDTFDVVGPLGHGFEVPEAPGADVLVGGGYGSAALAFLARALHARGSRAHAVLGGRSAERVFNSQPFEAWCETITITTDDGSAGEKGMVIDVLPRLFEHAAPRVVYACGPMPMLEAVGAIAAAHGVPSRLAVEEFMACGIGVCWTCVLPVRMNGTTKHLRSCTEGPVFEGTAIAWA
jgi:dihydroorotate dehydrogenase electron transfer subunit